MRSTMRRWTVSNSVSACWSVCVVYLLAVSVIFASSVTCRSACPVQRALRVANSSPASTSGRHVRSYVHLQGDVRQRKLFSFQKFFLRIGKDGRVNGTKSKDDPYTLLYIRVRNRAATVSLQAEFHEWRDVNIASDTSKSTIMSSNILFVVVAGSSQDASGMSRTYGRPPPRNYGINCRLKERIEENGYNTYASAEWRNKKRQMFVGLSAHGRPLRGRKTRRKNTATHFLPILV
ncbi:fibroblast growth factor 10 [Sinocyclocheilus rhinocerous]|uniref:fibroblast growth factor 10 n=1 Tax=Sinocyclocheilus rhinocerous TaxID=307959 RepID=UPI0007B8A84F|nr:PREDICTED: fibroblast growth factor 10 [Sinocyclocheilus rhinocerous]